jgi:hypothetical protein
MSNILRDLHCGFQDTDYDDDIIGIMLSLVNLDKWCREGAIELSIALEEPKEPEKFHKMQPHFPSMKYRKTIRKILAGVCKEQDKALLIQNLHATVMAISYTYHMPTEVIIEMARRDSDVTRDEVLKALLDDGMSTNLPKEPSGKDFSALYL